MALLTSALDKAEFELHASPDLTAKKEIPIPSG
jgi:hypothetical protein